MKYLLSFLLLTLFPLSHLPAEEKHTFSIGDKDFLLDGKKLQIRCGEIHSARVPKEYWRNRLQSCKAMGLNAVCAYLFWNFHEFEQGKFNWSGQADVAEFCKIAQEEGLWVILRPGPYACAEWDNGGLPWWLLKNEKIDMRSDDPIYMKASIAWLKEMGRVLVPHQITKGGNILMAQVENEYGSYGKDAVYMGKLRQAMVDAGFDIPLFACNPRADLKKGYRSDLFQVVNFGSDPKGGFTALREVQRKGPLMCGEFYPGWFDTWGAPHHYGKTEQYLTDLEYMLKEGASFSIYMAHGGTSFGMWAGADRPFKPDTSSYDYDAPISEAGWVGDKFDKTRSLFEKYLLPGEKLTAAPAALPVMSIPEISFTESAAIFQNLPTGIKDAAPRHMEAYDQGHGSMIYRCTVPAGPATVLQFEKICDFSWIYLNGEKVGFTDRRSRKYQVTLPERKSPQQLDILVETMGHVNFGTDLHDRKGITGKVKLGGQEIKSAWTIFPLKLEGAELSTLKWQKENNASGPAFWRGEFSLTTTADTFLDVRKLGKGLIWVNGHCLSRFWNIGPTQTCYLPGVWLKQGVNEIIVLDYLATTKPVISGVEKPILDELHPELDLARESVKQGTLNIKNTRPILQNKFANSADAQTVKLSSPIEAKQFCLEALNSYDGKPYAAIAELDLLDTNGNSIPHSTWSIAYTDSQEQIGEDGSATNAINGQTSDFWHTEWKNVQKDYPHQIVIDLGVKTKIGSVRYTPRAGDNPGKIKDYKFYAGDHLVKPATTK